MRRFWLPLLALLLAHPLVAHGAVSPKRAAAARAEASALWAAGQRHYAAGELAEAVQSFRRGFALDGRPEFLYAMGQAERKRGNCDRAIVHFKDYLRLARKASQRAAARLQIQRCEALVPPEPPTPPTPAKPPTPPVAEPPSLVSSRPAVLASAPSPAVDPAPSPRPPRDDDVRPTARRRWYRDLWGGLLLGLGVGALGGGGALVGVGSAAVDPLAYPTYGAYDEALSSRRALRTAGVVSLAVGGALVVGSVIRYVVAGRR
ncbi:MAG: hypothetical protein IT371_29220 [Deltaproteobacteria bacterium]|nr:hypothetical protein [Deltaproteobacteria bacterium]